MTECGGCNKELDSCRCQMIVYMFHETNRKLNELELLERLVGNVLTSLIHIRIEDHVNRSCKRPFHISQLAPLENVRRVPNLSKNKINKKRHVRKFKTFE